jgi:hypothetical protein
MVYSNRKGIMFGQYAKLEHDEIPNYKSQQPNSKSQTANRLFEIWILKFWICLGIGAWNL